MAISIGERATASRRDGSASVTGQVFPASLVSMALTSCGAAAIHFVVMPAHFEESLLYGGFFAAAASVQLLYALTLLARPSRPLIGCGMVANLLILAAWLVTRLVGIPLGPGTGTVEPFGPLDLLAGTFELVVVLAGARLLLRAELPGRRPAQLEVARPSTTRSWNCDLSSAGDPVSQQPRSTRSTCRPALAAISTTSCCG